ASMSHELRTPLNAIIGYSELLEEDALDLEYAEFIPDLNRIKTAGKLVLNLINSVLDLSKIEAGRMDLFLEKFDISLLIDELATTIYPMLQKNGNELEVVIDRSNIGFMFADLAKVRQSLLNLLSNASKFTRNGRVTLTAKRETITEQEWVLLSVADTGIGMTAAQAARVFQPYQQAEASTSRNFGGTGLGMAITKEFCEMMGGRIELETAVGQGATFTIWLPATVAKPAEVK
ncbi:MAG: HAMP domain-containing histidine kinase, partial [Anaerolineales bacterium]|nr:HAMP domain-containing histidine kinase [Anaerolineales bacterium]